MNWLSKLRADKISFDNDDFVVEVGIKEKPSFDDAESEVSAQAQTLELKQRQELIENQTRTEAELILNRARADAQQMVDETNLKAQKTLEEAQIEALNLKEEANEQAHLEAEKILTQAQEEASKLIENAKKESSLLLENSKEQIEKERIETIKKAYEEGYRDGEEKIREELDEKIQDFDKFCSNQYEIKNKILKTAGKDIFDIISNISKKIILQEPDANTLDKIIKNTVNLLEKKENISIILSEKYAKLLFELQQNKLADGSELDFSKFTQYEGFDILYNPELDSDTIIVENLKERFDASIKSQLDVIIRDILKNSNNGYLDTQEYLKENESEGIE